MQVKTSELTGAVLDWAVTSAEYQVDPPRKQWVIDLHTNDHDHHPYSTDWVWAGPIIDRERITIRRWNNSSQVHAYMPDGEWFSDDHSPLVAAMRCYVASKLGDTVEVPDELA